MADIISFNNLFLHWVSWRGYMTEFVDLVKDFATHIASVRKGFTPINSDVLGQVNDFLNIAYPGRNVILDQEKADGMWQWFDHLGKGDQEYWANLLFGILQHRKHNDPIYQALEALSPFPKGLTLCVTVDEFGNARLVGETTLRHLVSIIGIDVSENMERRHYVVIMPDGTTERVCAIAVTEALKG